MADGGVKGNRAVLAAEAARLKAQGMNGLQIADALGIGKSYAYELLSDPAGQNVKARKAKYDMKCMDCACRVSGTDGPRSEPRCQPCASAERKARRAKADKLATPEIPGLLPIWDKHGVADFARVDLDDWERLKGERWIFAARNYVASSANSNTRGAMRYLHHFVVGHVTLESGMHTDHINRQPTDNRRANLRIVTPAVNMANRGGSHEGDTANQIDPTEAAEARRVGEPVASIAGRFGVSRQSVYRALRKAA